LHLDRVDRLCFTRLQEADPMTGPYTLCEDNWDDLSLSRSHFDN